ncbi:MAG: GxxExxY protein [Candidatus Abyssobacteria bacterium SURF_17]|uniref:GxxExxY protein n=1 Tax=Candidatus Abyssobacteria bacterium SURF_17 TaxID=2093361 RepID=A0A419F1S9_9BACT|nr:MAG: GxxExxY protein [Candidatus Abyssubacteria bacterium SURF_17]
MGKLLYEDLTGKVIGAAMEVHTTLGAGFLESVYGEALAYEMQLRQILFERQKALPVYYKGRQVKEFICDFWIDGKILGELKAVRSLTNNEEAQLMNYLKATDVKLGMLLNFGEQSLKFKRLIL